MDKGLLRQKFATFGLTLHEENPSRNASHNDLFGLDSSHVRPY
jgi:hypothetical protein